jgi:hypothetical protein
MTKDELPRITEILRNKITLKEVPEGIKMTYVRNKFARRLFVISFFLALYLGHLFVVETTYEGRDREYLGTVLMILFLTSCASFLVYHYLYKCTIIFNKKYIQVTNWTFYPRVQIIRKFDGHYLDFYEYIKVVHGSHDGYRTENRYPMVYMKSKYHLVEIHHPDLAYAEEHKKLIVKCLKKTDR